MCEAPATSGIENIPGGQSLNFNTPGHFTLPRGFLPLPPPPRRHSLLQYSIPYIHFIYCLVEGV
jgi:hypothetical protein